MRNVVFASPALDDSRCGVNFATQSSAVVSLFDAARGQVLERHGEDSIDNTGPRGRCPLAQAGVGDNTPASLRLRMFRSQRRGFS